MLEKTKDAFKDTVPEPKEKVCGDKKDGKQKRKAQADDEPIEHKAKVVSAASKSAASEEAAAKISEKPKVAKAAASKAANTEGIAVPTGSEVMKRPAACSTHLPPMPVSIMDFYGLY